MKLNDKKLFAIMQQDKTGKPDDRIEDRLRYAMMLKNSAQPVRQNSMAGFVSWLFSFHGMGIKMTAISCLLVVSMLKTNLHQSTITSGQSDSIFFNRSMVADSTLLMKEFKPSQHDTLF